MDERERIYAIVNILVRRLGGEVEIDEEEILSAQFVPAELTRDNFNHKIVIRTKEA